jgi:hypothetical protein
MDTWHVRYDTMQEFEDKAVARWWWAGIQEEKPVGGGYKVTYTLTEGRHDGYCSGFEEGDGDIEWVDTKCVRYMPHGSWDFAMKRFKIAGSCMQDSEEFFQSGYCRVNPRVCLVSVEMLE